MTDGAAGPSATRPRRIDLRWTKGRKQRFLDALSATYDMEAACAAAGLDWPTICKLRARDPLFAADWAAVMAVGYDRLEAMLLRRAGAGTAPPDEGADLTLARELLRQRGTGRASGTKASAEKARPVAPKDREQIIGSIMSKVAARRAARTSNGTEAKERVEQQGRPAPVDAPHRGHGTGGPEDPAGAPARPGADSVRRILDGLGP